jgi:four helix bundle protein
MKYERFEDLPAWRAAVDLGLRIYAVTRDRFFAQAGDLRSQLRRAALSVSNNIAEGFERGTTAELISFLYIARGSAGEVRSMLCFVERSPDSDHLQSQISNLKSLAENCSRQIRGWTDHLQNSSIKGQRHLNDGERHRHMARKEADDFQRQLAANLHRALPHIYPKPSEKE